jgi:hypothetical protein
MSIKTEESLNQQISNKINEPIPKYDNKNNTSTSEKTKYFFTFIGELLKFYGVGLITVFPMEISFVFGFIVYIFSIGFLFLKNPLNWINNSNGGAVIFLALFGGFLIIASFIFYSRKKHLHDDDKSATGLSYFGKILSTSIFIIVLILIAYILFNFTAYFSDWSKYVFLMLNLLIFIGITTIILNLFGLTGQDDLSTKEDKPSWFKLILKVILYIPCLGLQFIDYLKQQYSITTKPIILLLIAEILLISIYFLLPKLISNIMTHKSSVLITKPINTDQENTLGTFQEVNYVPNLTNSNKQFSYQYAISAWIYLDSFPPETNASYSEYTSLLNIGNTPNILFNVVKNKLKIMLKTQGQSERILFETTSITMQRWNHLVINYDGNTLDIFINNELVSSTPGVIPYNNNTFITSGSENGIKGGICNVRYFREDISRSKINWLYNSVNQLNPPIF